MHIRFKVGQLVSSRKLKIRGVILDFDNTYYRTESSYQLSNDKSNKNKPWYLVLLDDCYCSIYLSEDDILPDFNGKKINNPLVEESFVTFESGMYFKNLIDVPHQVVPRNSSTITRVK